MSCDRGQISDLVDGRLAGQELDGALASMSDDEACAQWRMYHLIGDTLRARELCQFDCDTDFVTRLRGKLGPQDAAEVEQRPVTRAAPMIDTAQPAANEGNFRWKLVAGMASFLAVAAIGWTVVGAPGGAAGAGATGPVLAAAQASAEEAAARPVVASALVGHADRDAELGHLLAAHRQMAGDAALDDMTGFIHNVAFEDTSR